MRNARTKPKTTYRRRTRKTNKVPIYRDPDLIGVVSLETSHYITLVDYANSATDLFSSMASGSNDYSQYRDIYSEFRMISVQFDFQPAFVNSSVSTDNAMGMFGVKQGVYEATPTTVSVATLQTYPGSQMIHNQVPKSLRYKIYPSSWFGNVETNSLASRIPKFIFYTSWYRLANTNTGQGIIRVRVWLQARGKIV